MIKWLEKYGKEYRRIYTRLLILLDKYGKEYRRIYTRLLILFLLILFVILILDERRKDLLSKK